MKLWKTEDADGEENYILASTAADAALIRTRQIVEGNPIGSGPDRESRAAWLKAYGWVASVKFVAHNVTIQEPKK